MNDRRGNGQEDPGRGPEEALPEEGAASADPEAGGGRLLRSTLTVGGCTLVSRILGLVRDIVIAGAFGAGAGADAFFVAFRIPNLFRRLFAEGAFSQAFVPVLSEYRTTRSPEAVRDLVAHVAGALGLVLVVATALGVLAAPWIVLVFAPGFADDPDRARLAGEMLRLTFPYLLFISLTALAGGVLNAHGRFWGPAFTPVLLNVSLIGAALWLAPRLDAPVVALAWGVFLGGVVQLAFQLPFLRRLGVLVRPRLRRGHEGVRRVVRLMIPALFGASVAQVNLLVDTLIASFLATGAISWLYYADRMVEFPLGVFGIALGTVILPRLSVEHASEDPAAFSGTLDWALRLSVLIALPAALGLALLAAPILSTLFQYGAFGAEDVALSARALAAYSAGLVGFVGVKVLAPAFFARQDTRTPVRIAAMAMLANMVLNLALVFPLGHAGLALATSLSGLLNAGWLLRTLRRQGLYRPGDGWAPYLARVGVALGAMVLVLVLAREALPVGGMLGAGERATRLGALVAAGALAYLGTVLALLGGVGGMRALLQRDGGAQGGEGAGEAPGAG